MPRSSLFLATRKAMTSSFAPRAPHAPAAGASTRTITALSRWSCLATPLPAVDKVKTIHVYDFDNTLFKTPLPNPALWNGPTIGLLSSPDTISNGGWWHDARILASTGDGADAEEPRAWRGFWNEKVVDLVRLSMKQKDALTVLLTGRSEKGFADLIKRMCGSKGLEFDMMGLKPVVGPEGERIRDTMHFKQIFLEAIMETYSLAEEIRVYEDRHKHVKKFREFLTDYNLRQNSHGPARTRGPIVAEVIHVMENAVRLDPVTEVAQVQQMINEHNDVISKRPKAVQYQRGGDRLAIKKTVFFTSYMVRHSDSQKLIKLAQIPTGMPEQELKYHGNNILICPRPCPASILEKVGGMGSKMRWMVTGTACFENSIWAACVRPVPDTAKFHTDNPCPLVVLALRKGARPVDAGRIQNWQPVPADKAHVFETTVREKVLLRIEPEDPREDEYESLFANKVSKRKHNADGDDGQHYQHHQHRHAKEPYHGRGGGEHRGGHHYWRGGNNPGHGRGAHRGGAGRGYRGGGRGASRGGRGRGGGYSYRSLDDVDKYPGGDYDENRQNQSGQAGGGRGTASGSDLQNYY